MKWYEKTWEWIKKYWGIVLSAVTLAVGYVIGRKQSVSGLDGVYRQALLDVPQQEGFPNNITWPEAPDDRQL